MAKPKAASRKRDAIPQGVPLRRVSSRQFHLRLLRQKFARGDFALRSRCRSFKRSPANTGGLLGLFGHTRDECGDINWQFEIVGKIDDSAYAIQLFSWVDGMPTDVKIMQVEQLRECSLYSTRSAWIDQWKKERSPYRRKAA